MRASRILPAACALAFGVLPLTMEAFYYKERGPERRYTGAPGDSPFACASAGCHTSFQDSGGGPLNFHGGSVTAAFSQGSSYTPGQPVTITVRVADPVNRVFGFQMTARRESDLANAQAGRFSFQAGTGIQVICDNDAPRTPNGNCPASAAVEFIEHTQPSTSAWTFTWTPPVNLNEPVHFYVAGNAANGNSSDDEDDHIYTNEYVLTPIGSCVDGTPTISGAISAGAFGARADFAPGTWLEVYGSNLSSITKEWAGADFNGLTAPQVLDRVRVKVNGQDAYTRFISPSQVNVQAPENAGSGPMNVTVQNCDKTSAPVSLSQASAAPGLLASDGKLVAFAPDGTLRAARPGEMIVAYGIGFGATNPAVAPGEIASGLTSLAEPLTVTIGGAQLTPAQIVYAGLAPGFVGLYQFNLIVPDVPNGNQPVTMRLGTTLLPQALTVAVQR